MDLQLYNIYTEGGGVRDYNENINYQQGGIFAAPLAPGYFINPAAAAILDTFDNNTNNTGSLDTATTNGSYVGVSWTEMKIKDEKA